MIQWAKLASWNFKRIITKAATVENDLVLLLLLDVNLFYYHSIIINYFYYLKILLSKRLSCLLIT